MKRFLRDHHGNVASIFALTLIPVLGLAGTALDYSRANALKEQIRSVSDHVALAIAASESPGKAPEFLDGAKSALQERLGDRISQLSVTGTWLDASNYRVSISGDLTTTIAAAVPGMPKSIGVGVATVVNRLPASYRVLPPHMSLLEPEAADYNRAYIYCYNPARKGEPDNGRRGFVPIADNATPPTDFSKKIKNYALPQCTPEEFPAYMMRNVRNSRTQPSNWDRNNNYYEYYTDTVIDQNTHVMSDIVVSYYIDSNRVRRVNNITTTPMLETILCDNAAQCRQTNEGGILPMRQTNRDPRVATGGCTSGKYMYYGWEDRPGGDRDYDDIRIIISCPEREKVSDKHVRIVE